MNYKTKCLDCGAEIVVSQYADEVPDCPKCSVLKGLSTIMNSGNREKFNIGKAAALAEIICSNLSPLEKWVKTQEINKRRLNETN